MTLQVDKIIRKDFETGLYIWDEWLLYEDIDFFSKVYGNFYDKFSSLAANFDFICSLGKSGYPLAAKFAYDTNKPLLISSLSEFVYEDRAYILGIPPDINLNGKSLFCVDSHSRSGGTIKLASNIISIKNFKKIDFAVIYNCLESKHSDQPDIKSLTEWKEINSLLLKIVDAERIAQDDFWMKYDKYWLTYVESSKWELNSFTSKEYTIEKILPADKSEGFITDKHIKPLDLYLKTNIFKLFIEQSLKLLQNKKIAHHIDTVVALSVAAVPFAFNMAIELRNLFPDTDIRFIFLMNEHIDYYKNEFLNRTGFLLCDDTVMSGGLLYAVYSLLIGRSNATKIKGILTFFDCDQFPKKGRKYLDAVLGETSSPYLAGISSSWSS